MKGIDRIYTGDFNTMSVRQEPDGSQVITLTKDGENKIWRIRVKNLYAENEEVLEDVELEAAPPAHILKRQKEAKQRGIQDKPDL